MIFKKIYISIDKQLVKEKWIKIVLLPKIFNIFNVNKTRSKSYRVTQFILSELEMNKHIENINIVVMSLNSMDIFLEYDWLVKHNPRINYIML